MKKLLILFTAKTPFISVQKKDISLKKNCKGSFKTKQMNSMNGNFNTWILKPINFETNKPINQRIYLGTTAGIYPGKIHRYIYSIK